MNSVVATTSKTSPLPSKVSAKDASEEIRSRHSKELIIALSGPVGCGLNHVKRALNTALKMHGYEVVDIKISSQFESLANNFGISVVDVDNDNEFDRITALQDLGNKLRTIVGRDLAAQLALTAIANDRATRHQGIDVREIKPDRIAYIIDQLKNPSEVTLLREIYGNIFYSIGVLAGYDKRKKHLCSKMKPEQAEILIERDKSESISTGQQLEKTLKLSDYFARNDNNNSEELEESISRFVKLLHGDPKVTPTILERGMHAAYSASLRSACLSRQVGAAIVDSDGNLISTGCNDVPKAGGGLYDGSTDDHRCIFRDGGQCFNDLHKDRLRDEIERLLRSEGIEKAKATSIAAKIRGGTRLKDLIEFSRAVHAEMDAIISISRRGSSSTKGCSLFTTTYPCHNCARHIVAAGISTVYFIEPYGKSLAGDLHQDAITHTSGSNNEKLVEFLHFEGISPARFSSLFYSIEQKKDEKGVAIVRNSTSAEKVAPELLDNYRELEAKIMERMQKRIDAATKSPTSPSAA